MNRDLPTARAFKPLLEPARYKGAYGGRASGKSHFFAELMFEEAARSPGDRGGEGLRAVCVREVQKSLVASAKLLIQDKIKRYGGPRSGFRIYEDKISTPGDGLILFQGMRDHTAESVKSLEGFRISWIEEGQSLSARSLELLRPTIMRVAGAEIWGSWNPTRATDPVDVLFRGPEPPTGTVSVRANWRDNPFRTPETDLERLDSLRADPDSYPHIWEGEYAVAHKGAYFARHLAAVREEGRICEVPRDPLFVARLFIDIGGTGARSDAFSIWAAQFVGRAIHVLDYYETCGQDIAAHLGWMRSRKYMPGDVQIYLPHDGRSADRVYQVSYESAFRDAGYDVEVVPNQGPGAAAGRIEALRRRFPSMHFASDTTQAGLDALGWYHERRDPHRNVGLGPVHDWSSHAADAAGLMAIVAEDHFAHFRPAPFAKPVNQRLRASSWRL